MNTSNNKEVLNMSVFRFRIYKDNRQILTNWINAEDREDAMHKLEQEHKECEIRLTEVFGATWKCEND